ncbi:hypothetical protein [Eubacterium callanderi]|uniref:hypothetical protein n=1 Tax=Eubacterium callanderi TaxID=53442 RepID=UPI001AA0E8C9|nr:hypothetical protein [Eubacterium callanderi]MBO1701492.1 hypothetical protein [Eubacterium callanderi]
MSELVIENGVVIDDAEAVLEGISKLSGKNISSAETFKKFITNEKATKFYIDSKCTCKMQPDRDTVYLWLDSGFVDYYGNPIMISLLNSYGEYRGHYFGSFHTLSNAIRGFFPRNIKDINRNLGGLRNKYEYKIADRKVKHIEDENEFFLSLCNEEESFGTMSFVLENIKVDFAEEEQKIEDEITEEEVIEPAYDMNFREKEITIGLLLETIDGIQDYIDELFEEIEKFNSEDKVRMAELEAKNEEYKAALVRMRNFVEDESAQEDETEEQGIGGHSLLGRNGKILVLGASALDQNTMNGIAKLYGFHKKDFEYETDYTKVVNFAGRISNSERYVAIIFGACPHKVAGLGDWSSIIEKCRQCEDMPCAFDARSHSGELKVTKESFKTALWNVCNELKLKKVC